MTVPGTPGVAVVPARNAVATVFVLNGLLFATLFSRVPDLRERLDLTNGRLGSAAALDLRRLAARPAGQRAADRAVRRGRRRPGGRRPVHRGLAVVGARGRRVSRPSRSSAVGLGCYGFGTAVWDVAMNVEGAEVERRLGRTVLPRFHAGWSFGSIGGAGIGVLAARFAVPAAAALPRGRGGAPCSRCWSPSGRSSVAKEHDDEEDAGPQPLGLARAAHRRDRRDGAGLHAGRGVGQRLAGAGAGRRLRRPALRRASPASRCSSPR